MAAIGTFLQLVYESSPIFSFANYAANALSLNLWFFDFMGYYNGQSLIGDPAVIAGGVNRGALQLAQSDLDCALEGADEKLQDGFGAKMHFYL